MTTATADVETAKKGNSKLLLVIIAAAVVVLLAGGFFAYTMLKPAEAEPDPATTAGAVVALEEDMTLNLADGKFLKTGLALQLTEEETTALGGEKGVAAYDGSMARDAAISILGKYKYEQLLDPAVRQAAQKTLSAEVKDRYDGAVMQVYFTQFVMQ